MRYSCNGYLFLYRIIIIISTIRSTQQTNYSCDVRNACGCSSKSAVVNKIVGGESADSQTWGWAVSISLAGGYLCSGSILSNSWIVTAAHCLNNFHASQVTVYAGSITRWTGSQIRTVSHIIIHPNYTSSGYLNDIGLLHLTSPFLMDDTNLATICLPSVNSTISINEEWPPINTTVVAIGWGLLSETGPLPSILQQVTLQTIDRQASTCTPLLTDWEIQLCAGVSNGSKDTCYGDSGGPLMMFTSDHQWVLVGITSNGIGCARTEYSGIYTRVVAYQNWIESTMNNRRFISIFSSANSNWIRFNYFLLLFFIKNSTDMFIGQV